MFLSVKKGLRDLKTTTDLHRLSTSHNKNSCFSEKLAPTHQFIFYYLTAVTLCSPLHTQQMIPQLVTLPHLPVSCRSST